MPGKQSKMQFETKTIENTLRHCSNSDIRDILTISVVAAKQAGAILLDRYGKPHDIQHKGSIDIVTEADLASEELILDILHQNSPGTKILSEESWASSSIIEGQFLKGGECASGETPFSSLVDYLNRLCFLRVSVSIRSRASPLETLG